MIKFSSSHSSDSNMKATELTSIDNNVDLMNKRPARSLLQSHYLPKQSAYSRSQERLAYNTEHLQTQQSVLEHRASLQETANKFGSYLPCKKEELVLMFQDLSLKQ